MGRLIDADALLEKMKHRRDYVGRSSDPICLIEDAPTVTGWISVNDKLPESAGEYIVAYHPCYWDYVEWDTVLVGMDNFRGKTTWAKRKFQRVTHWMMKPEPPKEDN